MDQRVSVITLGVADLDRARRFYEDGLGWERGNNDDGVAFYQLPGMILGLWSRSMLAEEAGVEDGGARFAGIALAYNARTREDVDRLLLEAEAAGGTITKPAADMFWGGYSGYFTDPDGVLWEVAWNPFWPIDEKGRVSLSGTDSGKAN